MNIPIMKPTLPRLEDMGDKIREALDTGVITNAKYVRQFEEMCAETLGSKHAVAVSTGTTALLLPILCMGLEGEVILPSYTWCATAHVLLWNGITPVFVDIEADTFTINPDRVEAAITERTSAIIGVHIAGNSCDVERLAAIADKHRLKLIYDSAHVFGATYKGEGLGGFGDCGCYSFSPTKTITTGEGGMITTNNGELAEKIRLGRNQGVVDGNSLFIGMNARMSEIQGIIGISMMGMYEELLEKKLRLAGHYIKRLSAVPGIVLQKVRENAKSTYKDMTILVDETEFGMDRDGLSDFLAKAGIATKKYYFPAVHRQDAYREYREKYDASLPVTNYVAGHCLNLPLYPEMTVEQVDAVVDAMEEARKRR